MKRTSNEKREMLKYDGGWARHATHNSSSKNKEERRKKKEQENQWEIRMRKESEIDEQQTIMRSCDIMINILIDHGPCAWMEL